MNDIEAKITLVINKWEVNKTIQIHYPEQYENIKNQQKVIFTELVNKSYNKLDKDIFVFRLADYYLDLFDEFNIELEEKTVNMFCYLLVSVYDEYLNGKSEIFDRI